jgi:Zn-dependent peptidase ImmA (M78 family)/transcriptional regulator with XRE-family HTH domain
MPQAALEVDSRLVRWARRTAGFSLAEAAKKAKLPENKLREWEESPKASPTARQLERLADAYKRPIAAFFLSRVPSDPVLPADFRRVPGGEQTDEFPSEALFAFRRAEQLRAAFSRLEEWGDPNERLSLEPVAGKAREAAATFRQSLGVTLAEQREIKSFDESFRRWRGAVETKGVLVLQFPRIKKTVFRGFSLIGAPPVIAIRSADFVLAKSFTLFHECAHLLRRQAGVCTPEETLRRSATGQGLEAWCNAFAAEVLAPIDAFRGLSSVRHFGSLERDLEGVLAEALPIFKVGRFVVLRRLLTLSLITIPEYLATAKRWSEEPKRKGGGGNKLTYYHRMVGELGRPLVRRVMRATDTGALSEFEASAILGVRMNHLPTLRTLVE